jgi:hypothetical protein
MARWFDVIIALVLGRKDRPDFRTRMTCLGRLDVSDWIARYGDDVRHLSRGQAPERIRGSQGFRRPDGSGAEGLER